MELNFKDAKGKKVKTYTKKRTTMKDWLLVIKYQGRQLERNKKLEEVGDLVKDDTKLLEARISANKQNVDSFMDGINVLVSFYGDQFSAEEAIDGLNSTEYNNAINEAVTFALGGELDELEGNEEKK
ncbi:hypothetical protein EP04_01975 [Listeria monocytogenes]|uniref:Phage tail protein n=1 Tax=Listeria innocua TaxID=1642 RepID=A0AB73HAL8_LISIO|nr:hypothetical protein [Listeria innocua]EAE1298304.1 hypothetical protein [Listeria monocytogenes]MBC2142844.1 hypothetical protein [Listeria innocua]